MYALIKDSIVLQLVEEKFPVHPEFQWIDIKDNDVHENDSYINGVFGPPLPVQPTLIPDTAFRKAVKIMIKNIMLFINGQITKDQLNARYAVVKEYIEQIID